MLFCWASANPREAYMEMFIFKNTEPSPLRGSEWWRMRMRLPPRRGCPRSVSGMIQNVRMAHHDGPSIGLSCKRLG